jgi:hypothetical protein
MAWNDGLVSTALDFAQVENARIVQVVIEDLRSRSAHGIFGDVAARHLWDEYCWALQEGPFDDEMGWDNIRLGSLSSAFEDVVSGSILTEVEKLPEHLKVFLSALAFKEDDDRDEDDSGGGIWVDGIVGLVFDEVNRRASRPNLDLIGPDRSDVIAYEIEGSGMVWSILSDKGIACELMAGYTNEMIDPDGDLSELADEMMEAFMEAATESEMLSSLLDHFEDDVRKMVREGDVLPSLEDMRESLLASLDK